MPPRRAGAPDPELGNIRSKLQYSVYIGSILAAAGLPTTLRGDEAMNFMSEHGYFKDGCEKLLVILEGLENIPEDFLERVRTYNKTFTGAQQPKPAEPAAQPPARASLDNGAGAARPAAGARRPAPLTSEDAWNLANDIAKDRKTEAKLIETASVFGNSVSVAFLKLLKKRLPKDQGVEEVHTQVAGSVEDDTSLALSDLDLRLIVEFKGEFEYSEDDKTVRLDNAIVEADLLTLIHQAFEDSIGAVRKGGAFPSVEFGNVEHWPMAGVTFASDPDSWDVLPAIDTIGSGIVFIPDPKGNDPVMVAQTDAFGFKIQHLKKQNKNVASLIRVCKLIKAVDQRNGHDALAKLPSCVFMGAALLVDDLRKMEMVRDFAGSFQAVVGQVQKCLRDRSIAMPSGGYGSPFERIAAGSDEEKAVDEWLSGWLALHDINDLVVRIKECAAKYKELSDATIARLKEKEK